jgi:hypothetical protein
VYGSVEVSPPFPTLAQSREDEVLVHLPGALLPSPYPPQQYDLGSFSVIHLFTLDPNVLKQKSA